MSASKPNFFSDGLKRAQSGLRGARTPTRSAEDDAILARAVTAGAYAGAVAGASAAAATVRAQQSQSAASLPARADSGQREWQRTWDERTKAFYYWSQSTRETTWTPPPEWASPGAGAGGSAAELAQTLERTFVQKADLAEPLGHSTPLQARTQDSPSLYARDTDIDTEEEVDPRVGEALEEMNSAMGSVNDSEAALTQARRRAKQVEAEQRKLCQDSYDKLSRGVKEALPTLTLQLLAAHQQTKTQMAFVNYQRAHDAHVEAKVAIAALESCLTSSSGGAQVDVELLSQCSDLASRVVQAESAKLRADHVHAVEARRLSSLLLDIQAGPRVTREHAERAQPYLEVKAHAESLLRGAVARIKEVEAQLASAKRAYSTAMSRLDSISREIHEQREKTREKVKSDRALAEAAERDAELPRAEAEAAGVAASEIETAAGGTTQDVTAQLPFIF